MFTFFLGGRGFRCLNTYSRMKKYTKKKSDRTQVIRIISETNFLTNLISYRARSVRNFKNKINKR